MGGDGGDGLASRFPDCHRRGVVGVAVSANRGCEVAQVTHSGRTAPSQRTNLVRFCPHQIRAAAVSASPRAPTQQYAETDSRHHRSSQFLAVGNRNETGSLVTDFYHTNWNSPHASTATAPFAPSTGIAHTASARPSPIAIHYFCNWYDRLSVG